jgi:hypothetical protein
MLDACQKEGAGISAFAQDLLLLEHLDEENVPGRDRHHDQDDSGADRNRATFDDRFDDPDIAKSLAFCCHVQIPL